MTVSRVLNEQTQLVKHSTYERVRSVIEELNFVPNQSARALAGARNLRIGIVYLSPFPFSFYLDSLIVHTADTLTRLGMQMSVIKLSVEDSIAEQVKVLDKMAIDLDGLIVPPPLAESFEILELLHNLNKPHVLLTGQSVPGPGIRICIDNFSAAKDISCHLINLGHTRIAFVSGGDNYDSKQREMGYRRALAAAELDIDENLILYGTFSYASGVSAAESLLTLAVPPSAIFAANDEIALGCVSTADKLGIKIPDELSIVGFDGSPLTMCVSPPLTSVSQELPEIAARSAFALDRYFKSSGRSADESATREPIVVPYRIIVGGTTAPHEPL